MHKHTLNKYIEAGLQLLHQHMVQHRRTSSPGQESAVYLHLKEKGHSRWFKRGVKEATTPTREIPPQISYLQLIPVVKHLTNEAALTLWTTFKVLTPLRSNTWDSPTTMRWNIFKKPRERQVQVHSGDYETFSRIFFMNSASGLTGQHYTRTDTAVNVCVGWQRLFFIFYVIPYLTCCNWPFTCCRLSGELLHQRLGVCKLFFSPCEHFMRLFNSVAALCRDTEYCCR